MKDPPTTSVRGRRLVRIGLAVAPVLALVAVANLALARYVAKEETLYQADHVAYWSLTTSLARMAATSPWDAAVAISSSVNRELNLLPSVPLAPVVGLAGGTRAAYVLSVVNLYALPAMLLLVLVVGLIDGTRRFAVAGWAVTTAVLLLPAWWQPIALGYLDVGGVAIAALIMVTWLSGGSDRGSIVRWLAMGFLVGLLTIFRRWWAFWSVTWCVMIAAEAAWSLATARPRAWSGLWPVLRGRVVAAAAAVGTLLVIAPARLVTILGTNWRDSLVAYKHQSGIGGELIAVVDQFGVLSLTLLGASVVTGLMSRRARPQVVMLAAQVALIFALFRRLQDPSPQHWYLYLPGLTVLLGLMLTRTAVALRSPGGRAGWIALMTAAGLVVSGTVLSEGTAGSAWSHIAPEFRIRPSVRHDLGEVRRLLGDLDRRMAVAPGWIYILASRGPLTDTTIGYANLSLGTSFATPYRVLMSPHLDRRDGFPDNLLRARYVVLPEPVQVPQPPVHARVVSEPARCLLDGVGIGSAFRRGGEVYELEGGVRVSVWDLIRPITAADVADLSERLRAFYPDRPDIWRPHEEHW